MRRLVFALCLALISTVASAEPLPEPHEFGAVSGAIAACDRDLAAKVLRIAVFTMAQRQGDTPYAALIASLRAMANAADQGEKMQRDAPRLACPELVAQARALIDEFRSH